MIGYLAETSDGSQDLCWLTVQRKMQSTHGGKCIHKEARAAGSVAEGAYKVTFEEVEIVCSLHAHTSPKCKPHVQKVLQPPKSVPPT